MVIIGLVRFLDLGLKVYVFQKADHFAVYPYPAGKPGMEGREMTFAEKEEFKKEQEAAQRENVISQRQGTASSSLAMILVGIPIFLYHWRIISRESRSEKD